MFYWTAITSSVFPFVFEAGLKLCIWRLGHGGAWMTSHWWQAFQLNRSTWICQVRKQKGSKYVTILLKLCIFLSTPLPSSPSSFLSFLIFFLNLLIYFWLCWIFSSVQLLSHVQLSATPWTAARQASLSITNSQSLPKLTPIESVMPSNHLILCRPLLLPPSIFPSISVFSNESVLCIRWPKYWSFSFSISPSNEH